ncbi:hypothetical protein [Thiorhodococcus drewsii]|uniref:hypothetical protein n=1 Tax=Thiorhodococcus drewsii TaxID=210408 RepID=UPI001111E262|nr:hypothetical protein [Thiorhodococcus drewsii]
MRSVKWENIVPVWGYASTLVACLNLKHVSNEVGTGARFLDILFVIIALLTLIAALLVIPEFRKKIGIERWGSNQTPLGRPIFQGEIASFEKSAKFERFIAENEGGIVFIDAFIDEMKFYGVTENPEPYFVLYDECFEPLDAGEHPSYEKCTGICYSIIGINEENDSRFYLFRGQCKIYGYFAVIGCDGPHQGLMVCKLKAINFEFAGANS